MPVALPDAERQAILLDICAGELSRNAIARKHNRSVGTISNIAAETGISTAFDRSLTENATRAREIDLKARRKQLQELLLDDVDRIREKFFAPYLLALSGKNGIDTKMLPEPDSASLRNYATSAAVLIDKHVALTRYESDSGAEGARGLIGGILAAITVAAGGEPPSDTPPEPVE